MTNQSRIARHDGRAILAQTRNGPVYESRRGGAAALVRGTLRRSRVPRRLITRRFVELILGSVTPGVAPCHVIGNTFAIARQARAAFARTTGRFPARITEIADLVTIRAAKGSITLTTKGRP